MQEKKTELPHGNFKITRHQGSMQFSDLLDRRKVDESKMTSTQDAKEKEVVDRRVAYEKCRGGCKCEGAECLAAGLYLCRYCNTYKRKKCGVAKCLKQYEDEGCTDLPLPRKARAKAAKPAAPCASKKQNTIRIHQLLWLSCLMEN